MAPEACAGDDPRLRRGCGRKVKSTPKSWWEGIDEDAFADAAKGEVARLRNVESAPGIDKPTPRQMRGRG